MFKRVERKRKRREEEEELGLDEDTKETLGLNDTDSDESDSDSHKSAQFDSNSDANVSDQEVDAASEDGGPEDETPISVAEALKDPIYLISLDPTLYGCVLCKGKLIKNAGMATVHRNANAHKRRFQHFKLLSANADSRSNAWELVREIRSTSDMQRAGSQEPSKRALKRQTKQASIREKRKHHKELKAKAIAKKALKKCSTAGETNPIAPSRINSRASLASPNQPENTRKKQKLISQTSTATIMERRDTRAKSPLRTKTSSKKTDLNKKLKSRRKTNKSL